MSCSDDAGLGTRPRSGGDEVQITFRMTFGCVLLCLAGSHVYDLDLIAGKVFRTRWYFIK